MRTSKAYIAWRRCVRLMVQASSALQQRHSSCSCSGCSRSTAHKEQAVQPSDAVLEEAALLFSLATSALLQCVSMQTLVLGTDARRRWRPGGPRL